MENEIFVEQPFAPIVSKGYSLLILNGTKLTKDNLLLFSTFQKLWTQSTYRHAVDGGLNLLYGLDRESPSVFIPHCISGDLDSIDPEVLGEYKSIGVEINETPDQESTDFEKAIKTIQERIPDEPIVVFGTACSGRMDHQMSQINIMAKYSDMVIYFLRDTSLMRILKRGAYTLSLNTGYEGQIGLFPTNGKCNVKTTGLKWNIDGPLEIGIQVSSSNEKLSDKVEIITDGTLLLTIELIEPQSTCCRQ